MNTVDFASFLNIVSSNFGQEWSRRLNFLFQHYCYTENNGEIKVAERLINLVNQNKFDSIKAQCEKLGYQF